MNDKVCAICGEPITRTDHPGVKLCGKRACRLENSRRWMREWKAKTKVPSPLKRKVRRLRLDWKEGSGR